MLTSHCLICSKEFNIRWKDQKFCSISCSNKRKGRWKLPSKSANCENCNREFKVKYKDHKYCSRSCAASINGNKFPKREKSYTTCLFCSKSVSPGTKKFCNTKCFLMHKREKHKELFEQG